MSRRKSRASRSRVPLPIWILGGFLGALVVYRFAVAPAAAQMHPDPRSDVTAVGVVPAARYATYPMVARTYEEARQVPQILDGLYCHCGCKEHADHRSLLTCFETDHGVGCDVCLQEAALAYRMHQDGATLKAIREAIDATFAD